MIEMTNKTGTDIEAVLKHLSLTFRKLPTRDGAFYFCQAPAGITFDLQCSGEDLRLWRFTGTAPLSRAGTKYEYQNPAHPYAVMGIEVTDDGDISLYAAQKLSPGDPQTGIRIAHMIKDYITMLSDIDDQKHRG